jgi:hypothetical protein
MTAQIRVVAGVAGVPNHVELSRFGNTDPQAASWVDGTHMVTALTQAVARCEAGHPYRVIGAYAQGRHPCTMVAGGADGLVPSVVVWGRRFRWTMDPHSARRLAGTIREAMARANRMDLETGVPCLQVAVRT